MTTKTRIAIWHVALNDGDWYDVFEKSAHGAVSLVVSNHYEMSLSKFMKTYKPAVRRRRDDETIVVKHEDEGDVTKTAAEFCNGESEGLFSSNTYSI